MNADATVLEIRFVVRVRRTGDWADGEWTAIITAKRLKSMFDQICEGTGCR